MDKFDPPLVPADQDADEAAEIAKRDPERGDADGPFGHEPEQPPQDVDELIDDVGGLIKDPNLSLTDF